MGIWRYGARGAVLVHMPNVYTPIGNVGHDFAIRAQGGLGDIAVNTAQLICIAAVFAGANGHRHRLSISVGQVQRIESVPHMDDGGAPIGGDVKVLYVTAFKMGQPLDRKSTRLNSSHVAI